MCIGFRPREGAFGPGDPQLNRAVARSFLSRLLDIAAAEALRAEKFLDDVSCDPVAHPSWLPLPRSALPPFGSHLGV
jgi:hypothetical protein